MPKQVVKRRLHWAAYLWPGLPHLWNQGSWAGLVLAVGFTILLNTLILAIFVWPQWLPQQPKLVCGLTVAAIWLAAIWETRGELRRQAARQQPIASGGLEDETAEDENYTRTIGTETHQEYEQTSSEIVPAEQPTGSVGHAKINRLDQLFAASQRHYLSGDWLEAERSLATLLRIDRDDIEARLLLAAAMRRTGRTRKAYRILSRLARREDANGWLFEINRELELLEATSETTVAEPDEHAA